MTTHDAIVVGAGPSGTWVADHLVRRGKKVLLLDAGPRLTAAQATDAEVAQSWPYETVGSHCDWLRVRAVGGGSLVWGGWAHRFSRQVFNDGWPYDLDALSPYYDDVEQCVGVRGLELNPILRERLGAIGLEVCAKRMALDHESVWQATRVSVSSEARENHVATQLLTDGGKAHGVVVVNAEGERKLLRSRAIVLAASPIETARLLLASGAQESDSRIGTGLVYHPVIGYALIHAPAARSDSWSNSPNSSALVPRFVNVNERFRREYRGGFSVEIFGPQRLSEFTPGVRSRIDPTGMRDDNARVTLIHGICETAPHPERYVSLSSTLRDCWGGAAPRIHCAWSDADRRMVADAKNTCLKIAELLSDDADLEIVQYLDPFAAPMMFHEAGTCAMGSDEHSICDPWGRLRTLSNVWIADASALASAGDCHPTLTILAHAARAAQSIDGFLQRIVH